MAGTTAFLLTLASIASLAAASKPVLTVSQPAIEAGVTQSLTLRCTAMPGPPFAVITTMTMSFKPQATQAPQTLATATQPAVHENFIDPNMAASGYIGLSKNESFLEITITSPTENHTGEYTCQANGFSPVFMPVNGKDVKVVNLTAPTTLKDLSKKLHEMEADLDHMKERWDAVDSSSVFHQSNVSQDGRRYLLSRSHVQHVNLCQFMCTVQGGYLAEIDDKAEFEFVQKFTRQIMVGETDYPDVFIGTTDHKHKGTFTFMHNTNNKPYLNWGGFPSNGYDCLILSQNSGYFMNDYDCEEASRFLCEIP